MADRSFLLIFEGSDVDERGVPFDQLVAVFEHCQTAVRRMAEYRSLKSNSPTNIKELFRDAGTLRLKGTRQGSLVAEIELAEQTTLVDLGIDALDDVLAGAEDPFALLPPLVAREIAAIPESLRAGVNTVTLRGGRRNRVVRLTGDARFQEPEKLVPPPDRVTQHGRLMEVDWSKGTAELHTLGGIVPLDFEESEADAMQANARRNVTVRGIATFSNEGRVIKLSVEVVGGMIDDMSYWHPDVAEDIERQSIQPFHSPKDVQLSDSTDADEFLEAIYGGR
jgi:hypothetical protein